MNTNYEEKNSNFITSDYLKFSFSSSTTTGQSAEPRKVLRAFSAIDIIYDRRMVTLEWVASPVNDMYADAILCSILQAESMESMPSYIPNISKEDKMHFKECLIEMLQVSTKIWKQAPLTGPCVKTLVF